MRTPALKGNDSDFLNYIVSRQFQPGDRLPPLYDIGEELSLSVGKLREQLQVARTMGLVSVKPRDGIRVEDYDFGETVRQSLRYALGLDAGYFRQFSELRVQIEAAFLAQAAERLTAGDHAELQALLDGAWSKLNGERIHIPHSEHRQLHLLIYRRFDNPFVLGLLEAYWDAYETVELNVYTDYAYLCTVWDYHREMVNAIVRGDYDAACTIFVEHTQLLRPRVEAEASTRLGDA